MQKRYFAGLLFSSVLLAGCTNGTQTSAPQTSVKEQVKQATKLADIMARDGSASCEIINLEDKTATTMQILGKKVKITGQDMGPNQKGTMLNDGVYTYIWSEGSKTGFKIKNPTEAEMKEVQDKAKQFEANKDYDVNTKVSGYDDQTKYSLDCKEGAVNDKDFIAPTTVQFTDPTEMVKNLPKDALKNIPQDALKNIPGMN